MIVTVYRVDLYFRLTVLFYFVKSTFRLAPFCCFRYMAVGFVNNTVENGKKIYVVCYDTQKMVTHTNRAKLDLSKLHSRV